MSSSGKAPRGIAVAWALLVLGAGAAEAGPDPLLELAHALSRQVSAVPTGLDGIFSESLLAVVPPDKMAAILAGMHAEGGPVRAIEEVERSGPNKARQRWLQADHAVPVDLAIGGEPARIEGIFFGPPTPRQDSLARVLADLAALPGKTSMCLMDLTSAPRELASLRPDERRAIGSGFKLWILGALVEDIEAGRRTWADVVALRDELRSLPAGDLRDWPRGSPLTLHTLATLMISVSDNTATDHLLEIVGRERVEAMQAPMGHGDPARNVPMLSTLEMFRLKLEPGRARAATWLTTDPRGRRAMLAEMRGTPRGELAEFEGPILVSEIEWFASCRELVAAMDWFRRRDPGGPARLGLELMAVNPGIAPEPGTYSYVGYKGGSEPGVLCFVQLLRTAAGRWLAVAWAWNDPDREVELGKLAGLAKRVLALAPGLP